MPESEKVLLSLKVTSDKNGMFKPGKLKTSGTITSSELGSCARVSDKTENVRTRFGRKLCKKRCGRDIAHETGLCEVHHAEKVKKDKAIAAAKAKREKRRESKAQGKRGRGKNRSKTGSKKGGRPAYTKPQSDAILDYLIDNMQEGATLTLDGGGVNLSDKKKKNKK